MVVAVELICIKCGNKKKSKFFPLCRDCTPYFYGKGKFPHQIARQTINWTLKRAEQLKKAEKRCKWCDEQPEHGLTIHHKTGVTPTIYRTIWEELVLLKSNEVKEKKQLWKDLWEKSIQEDSLDKIKNEIQAKIKMRAQKEQVKACPKCDSSQFSERIYQKPKFYCSNCKSEFKIPKKRSTKKYNKNKFQLEYLTLERIQKIYKTKVIAAFYDEIKKDYDKSIKKKVQDYLSMENTIVLCKKCHWAAENNKVLCKKCKKNYHEYKRDMCKTCEEEERKNLRKFNLDLLENDTELKEIKCLLRAEQANKCFRCKAKLYDLEFSVPLRKWKQECWKCGRQTEVVSYIIGTEMDNCVIGTHGKVDAILRDEYSHIEKLYSHTMKRKTTGNKCVQCETFQGNGYIEHDLVWDRVVYYDGYDEVFPIERILSIGHVIYLDKNQDNKDHANLKLVCFDCFEKETNSLI